MSYRYLSLAITVLTIAALAGIALARAEKGCEAAGCVYLPLVQGREAPPPSVTATFTPTSKPVVAGHRETFTPEVTRTPTNTPSPTSTPTPVCAAEYPDFCIPPPPPDLNCADIGIHNFTVLPPDRHGFDSDNDGIGCEA